MKRKQWFSICLAFTLSFAMPIQALASEDTSASSSLITENSSQTSEAEGTGDTAAENTPAPPLAKDEANPSTPAETPSAPAEPAENDASADNVANSGDESNTNVESSNPEPIQPDVSDDDTPEAPSQTLDDGQTSETPSDSDAENILPSEPEVTENPSDNAADDNTESENDDPIDVPAEPPIDTEAPELPNDSESTSPAQDESLSPEPLEEKSDMPDLIPPSEEVPDSETLAEDETLTENPKDLIPPPELVPIDKSTIIHVEVPSTGNVVVNPYGMNVMSEGVTSTAQIVHNPQIFTNYSTIPVQVKASVVGTVPKESHVIFVSQPPASDTADKEVFLYAEFQQSLDGSLDAPWRGKYIGASNQLVVSTSDSDKKAVLTLPAGDKEPSYGIYKLFGTTAVATSEMWTASDTIHVTISFAFSPLDSED